MLLKSLEIQGFKTFPDKTKLSFDGGISAVVGPNGSGKSNISDAIRWVLGEQSTKALRCSKMEDIVFNGTTTRRAQGFAQVTLNIDNMGRKLPFDGDIVAISRRYYRSGESEYRINSATVRLRDVHELFMDTGLGRDGYSMIGQGKIDSIVSARSEDRREIFEEAAGISRYRYRKEEAERKLLHAEENLLRLKDIVVEIEERIGPLREQAEKAKLYLTYSEEKRGLEIGLWLYTLNRSGRVLREHDDKISVARTQQDEILRSVCKLDAEMEDNFQKANACTARAETVRSQASEKEEQAVRLEGEISVLQNDIHHNGETLQRLQQELENSKVQGQNIIREIGKKRHALAEKEEEIRQQEKKQAVCSEKLEQLHQGMDQSSGQLEGYTHQLESLSAQSSEAKLAAMSAVSSKQEIALRLDSIAEAVTGKAQQAAQLEQQAKERKQEAADAEQQVSRLQAEVQEQETDLSKVRAEEEQTKKQRDQLSLEVQAQQRRISLLEELERNLEGFTHSVKAIMRESSKGVLRGIHGPVSRLITVPKDYAVAVEVALGAAMQNIVVGTEEDAKEAIRFLKKGNGGRATFLPVSTIRGNVLAEKDLETCSGFVGIAGNLCTCSPEYTGILHSLLGRIAVARDLDSAVAIAKQYRYRFRVVTLDGQVVNAGGSLTGGSLTKNAGLLSRASEMEQLKKDVAAWKQKAEQMTATWESIRQKVASAESKLTGLRVDLAQAQEQRMESSGRWNQARSDWETVLHQKKELETERQFADVRVGDLEAAQQQAEKQQQALLEQIAQIQLQIGKLSGSREEITRQTQALSLELQEIRLTSLAAQKDKEVLETSVLALEQEQASGEQRRQVLEREIQEIHDKDGQLNVSITQNEENAKRLREQAEEAKNEALALQEKRLAFEKRSAELRNLERETANTKETVARELARLEERKANLQKEYDEIVVRLWEEYELTRREAEEENTPVEEPTKAQKQLNEIKNKIRGLGTVNVAAVEEYQEVSERYAFLTGQIDDVEKSRAELRRLIGELTHQMHEVFLARFEEINRNFKETFAELFGGGTAHLELDDPENLLNCGIQIAVQPPGKIVTNLELLSGGEKALVAIALYFAIMKVSPPPFCVMDEIEAALDDVNVDRFASYLRRMNDRTQFIVITHRRGTMEEADVLYGVTMQDEGISKLLEMKPSELEQKLGMKYNKE